MGWISRINIPWIIYVYVMFQSHHPKVVQVITVSQWSQISHKLRLQSELSSMTSRCQRVEEACRVAQKASESRGLIRRVGWLSFWFPFGFSSQRCGLRRWIILCVDVTSSDVLFVCFFRLFRIHVLSKKTDLGSRWAPNTYKMVLYLPSKLAGGYFPSVSGWTCGPLLDNWYIGAPTLG